MPVVAIGALIVGEVFATATLAGAIIAGAIGGAIIGAVVGGITAAISGGDIGKGILMGAVTGAVTGAFAGIMQGPVALTGIDQPITAASAATQAPPSIGLGGTSAVGGEIAVADVAAPSSVGVSQIAPPIVSLDGATIPGGVGATTGVTTTPSPVQPATTPWYAGDKALGAWIEGGTHLLTAVATPTPDVDSQASEAARIRAEAEQKLSDSNKISYGGRALPTSPEVFTTNFKQTALGSTTPGTIMGGRAPIQNVVSRPTAAPISALAPSTQTQSVTQPYEVA